MAVTYRVSPVIVNLTPPITVMPEGGFSVLDWSVAVPVLLFVGVLLWLGLRSGRRR